MSEGAGSYNVSGRWRPSVCRPLQAPRRKSLEAKRLFKRGGSAQPRAQSTRSVFLLVQISMGHWAYWFRSESRWAYWFRSRWGIFLNGLAMSYFLPDSVKPFQRSLLYFPIQAQNMMHTIMAFALSIISEYLYRSKSQPQPAYNLAESGEL